MNAPQYRAEHIPAPGEWSRDALCAQIGPNDALWFPEKGARSPAAKKAAREICQRCSVRAACEAYVLEHASLEGTWAGLTVHDRKQLRRLDREAS